MSERPNTRLPVSVLTGFLGSGKTTLLSKLLRHPGMDRTAVVINEFGEVGLDHELVEASKEDVILLDSGCLCCTVRGDLVRTVGDLLRRRAEGSIPPFDRLVVETTGLADPAPVLGAFMTDPILAPALILDGVVATIDAAVGSATLDAHPEALKQAAVADRLVLTKTDLADATELRARLALLNPGAPILVAVQGEIDPAVLFDAGPWRAAAKIADVSVWLDQAIHAAAHDHHHHHHDRNAHDERIRAFAIRRSEPVPAAVLSLFLEVLAEHCGPDLLRMKGLVRLAEVPDRPAVIHGVQHVFHPPALLERWPSDDHDTRIVFIGRHIPARWVETVLAMLDAEVSQEENRRA